MLTWAATEKALCSWAQGDVMEMLFANAVFDVTKIGYATPIWPDARTLFRIMFFPVLIRSGTGKHCAIGSRGTQWRYRLRMQSLVPHQRWNMSLS
jgi:hypothetical protein